MGVILIIEADTGADFYDWVATALQNDRDNRNAPAPAAPAVPAPDHSVVNDLSVSSRDQTFPAPVPTTTSAQIPATYQSAAASLTAFDNFDGGFHSQGYWNEQSILTQGEEFAPLFVMASKLPLLSFISKRAACVLRGDRVWT